MSGTGLDDDNWKDEKETIFFLLQKLLEFGRARSGIIVLACVQVVVNHSCGQPWEINKSRDVNAIFLSKGHLQDRMAGATKVIINNLHSLERYYVLVMMQLD
ncbi:hypothetical protein F0562_013208 [Nyssa sinensis]|uniref:Uncharacterized protein n=1 Tax=Nyssa sinensis TaxID=561372 RepID=A0A5J4ZZD3_9ASTE|nr:hypothetical protein F0562_013208 [Nyssa sinensis]